MSEVLPTPFNPAIEFSRWLLATMAADAQIVAGAATRKNGQPGIYEGAAPEGAACPFVRFAVLAHPFTVGNGAIRVASEPLVLIEAIGETSSRASLETLANRIDALFGQRREPSTQGRLIVSGSWCEEVWMPAPEASNGVEYRRLGGKYRMPCCFAPE